MSFFSVFSEISRNKGNFKQWEQDKADQEAKREKYFAQNPPSQQELKKAKELGRVIVDSVDFMDAQSENKSESVEMASDMITGIASTTGGFAAAIIAVKNQQKRAAKLKGINDNLYKLTNELKSDNPEQAEIIKNLKENKLIDIHKSENGPDFINLKRGISEHIEGHYPLLNKQKFEKLSVETKEYFKKIATTEAFDYTKKAKGGSKRVLLAWSLTGLAIGSIGQVIGTILQVKASKIARYQARENLKDPKNFVQYNDEQREEAKKYIGEIKVPKDKKSGSIKDIVSVLKDYRAYKIDSEKLSNTHFYNLEESNPEESYKKQKILNNIIKKINNRAQEYSENMDTAAEVLLGCSVLGGALFGKIASFAIKKIDQIKEIADKKAAEKAGKTLEEFLKEKAQNLENEAKKLGGNVKGSRLKQWGKAIGQLAKANPTSFGVVLSTLIAIPLSTKLTKESSRAGRYKAKRELDENPQNFIYVDKNELSKYNAKGEVEKEGFLDILKFIPTSIKTMFEYEKYKKTTLRQKKAENEALKMTKISDEQLKEAKALKTRLYKSFDVIDDHSEEYSEKVDAVGEIAKDTFNGIVIPAALGIPTVLIYKNPQKIVKPLTGIVASVFKNFKGFTKKYASNIGDNAINKLTKNIKRSWHYERLAFAEKDIDEIFKTTEIKDFDTKIEALKVKMQPKLGEYVTKDYIEQIKTFKGNDFSQAIDAKTMDAILDSKEVKTVFEEQIKNFSNKLKTMDAKTLKETFEPIIPSFIDLKEILDKDLLKIRDNINICIEKIPAVEIAKSMMKIEAFENQKTMKAMLLKNNKDMQLKPQDIFLTKDINPIYYSIVGAYATGIIGLSYSIESYLASKTKQAGRLGTMKAIEDLNEENDKALEMSKAKKVS